MNQWLKYSRLGAAAGLAAALVIPSQLSAASFGLGDYSLFSGSGQAADGLLRVHCCHSHPYPPYDRYCCHGSGYYSPGRTVARTAAGAAIAYGAYRGVRSATKSAYKRGYSKAKKHIKRRR
jgi:hypothetical protein